MQSLLGGRKSHLSLKDALLHQPQSFAKKRNYEIKAQLGEGTFGKVKLATWHVPPDQAQVAQHGASADGADARSSADAASGNTDPTSAGGGGTLDIALKVIPKRKVKGNEASVWAEMDVLKGLDHPNIVRPCLLPLTRPRLTHTCTGQVLRVVREPVQVLPLLRARPWRGALRAHLLPRPLHREGRRRRRPVRPTHPLLSAETDRLTVDAGQSCPAWSTCTIMTSCTATSSTSPSLHPPHHR
jgi:hypothetical protein